MRRFRLYLLGGERQPMSGLHLQLFDARVGGAPAQHDDVRGPPEQRAVLGEPPGAQHRLHAGLGSAGDVVSERRSDLERDRAAGAQLR